MKSDIERGPFGAWAYHARKGLEWSSTEVAVREIERLTGHQMRADYLRGIESGNQRPGPDTVVALARAYGSTPPPVRPDPKPDPVGDIAALIERLDRQERAITALVAELRDSAASQLAFSQGVTRAFAALAGLREVSEEPVLSGQPASGVGR